MPAPRPLAPILVTVGAIAILAVMDGVMKGASLALGAYSAMRAAFAGVGDTQIERSGR